MRYIGVVFERDDRGDTDVTVREPALGRSDLVTAEAREAINAARGPIDTIGHRFNNRLLGLLVLGLFLSAAVRGC